ncbi:MAG: enoyl-CoA hydratase-related protein [Terriglobales bacterium]
MSSPPILDHVRLELAAPLARITVHRPEKLNALNRAALADLRRAFDHCRSEASLRAIVLTGAGEKAFVAGADIAELASLDAAAARSFSQAGNELFRRIETFPLPVLAAINGFALGGGLELALACSLRFASENARLGQPEVKLGLIPGYGGTQRLPRLIGSGPALQMLLSGEPITAPEALRLGLVNAVFPPADLLPAIEALAHKIAAHAPLAVRYCLQAVRAGADTNLDAALELEASLFGLCCASDDVQEGTRAFVEKRAPVFHGR